MVAFLIFVLYLWKMAYLNKITKLDVRMYNMLHDAVHNAPYTLGKVVPTFIINEAIFFFQEREEYEKCHHIKSFFDKHSHRIIPFSRKEYFDYGWETIG